MKTLLNYENNVATIDLNCINYNKYTIKSKISFDELSDQQKQDIASKFIDENILVNCNDLVQSIVENCEHEYYNDALELQYHYEYEQTFIDHLYDLDLNDLLDLAIDQNINVNNKFKSLVKKELNYNRDAIQDGDLYCALYELDLINEGYIIDRNNYKKCFDMLVEYVTSDLNELEYDDFDTIFINLNVQNNYEMDIKSALEQYIIDIVCSKDDQYIECILNDLDAEIQQSENYEFYIVTHTFRYLFDTTDILGLEVWARGCTGQRICLDYDMQEAAFKYYSDFKL